MPLHAQIYIYMHAQATAQAHTNIQMHSNFGTHINKQNPTSNKILTISIIFSFLKLFTLTNGVKHETLGHRHYHVIYIYIYIYMCVCVCVCVYLRVSIVDAKVLLLDIFAALLPFFLYLKYYEFFLRRKC